VDNVTNSPEGPLRTHNYWDNEAEFVAGLANVVRALAGQPTPPRAWSVRCFT
jgi:hypothetical protein